MQKQCEKLDDTNFTLILISLRHKTVHYTEVTEINPLHQPSAHGPRASKVLPCIPPVTKHYAHTNVGSDNLRN